MTKADFNDLVQQSSRKLYGYAFRLLRNQEEAEDAVQEIFIKLWKMRDELYKYDSVDALAIKMIKNYSIDQLRKHRNVFREENLKQDYHNISSPSPHELMELSEINKIIHKIIDHLPEGYRIIVRLRDIEGFSYEEIAEKTGQNINTMRVTLSRARKFIRDEFNKFQYERRGIKQVTGKIL